MSVDFPAPLAPSSPCTSPAATVSETSSSARDGTEGLADILGFQQRRGCIVTHPRKRASRTRNWSTLSFVTISFARK